MAKYRVVTVPQRGESDKYQVRQLSIAIHPWWEFKKPSEKWCPLDSRGWIWWSSPYRPSPPRLKLFATEDSAKRWIEIQKEYLKKKSKVVFET